MGRKPLANKNHYYPRSALARFGVGKHIHILHKDTLAIEETSPRVLCFSQRMLSNEADKELYAGELDETLAIFNREVDKQDGMIGFNSVRIRRLAWVLFNVCPAHFGQVPLMDLLLKQEDAFNSAFITSTIRMLVPPAGRYFVVGDNPIVVWNFKDQRPDIPIGRIENIQAPSLERPAGIFLMQVDADIGFHLPVNPRYIFLLRTNMERIKNRTTDTDRFIVGQSLTDTQITNYNIQAFLQSSNYACGRIEELKRIQQALKSRI